MHDEILTINHPPRDIPEQEYFDNRTQMFITVPGRHVGAIHLQLCHSLMSMAKWESRWHEPFMEKEDMTAEELLDYIRCMTINPQKDQDVYRFLIKEDFEEILDYMKDPMSAVDLTANKKKPKRGRKKKQETCETIYCAMFNLGIPKECEKWHFNRLSALIDVCAEADSGSSKAGMNNRPKSQREIMELYHAMNQKNRKKYNSKG